MKKYRVGLVGLGHIASGYGEPGETAPYCHAGGIAQSETVYLAAAADPSEVARQSFERKWGQTFIDSSGGVALYSELDRMLAESQLDILGVCVRGPLHFSVMRQVLESPYRPRAIFLEKPAFCSLAESDEISALAGELGLSITMSYSRHWAPHVLKLEELVRDGLIGQVQAVVGYGAGPLLSFTSHTTDLICQFACAQSEDYDAVAVTASGIINLESGEVPPAYVERGYEAEIGLRNIAIEFSSGVTATQVGARTEHGQFYVDVFGEKGQVRAGFDLAPAAWAADATALKFDEKLFPPAASVFRVAYDEIAGQLAGERRAACTDNNWRQVNEIGFAAIDSARSQERVTLPVSNRERRVYANG